MRKKALEAMVTQYIWPYPSTLNVSDLKRWLRLELANDFSRNSATPAQGWDRGFRSRSGLSGQHRSPPTPIQGSRVS